MAETSDKMVRHRIMCRSLRFVAGAILFCLSTGLDAQVLRGTISNQEGTPLPYATIYISEMGTGTASNVDGQYFFEIPRGTYEVIFQYLGHQTVVHTVVIAESDRLLDVVLQEEPTTLQTIQVREGAEDPAYTIMRKAIAKAKFHTQQLDHYQVRSYIKGSGRLKKLPWLFRKRLEREMKKEGIDTATAFVTESVSEITYTRPDQFEEHVVSIRKIGEDNNTSPNEFVKTSFYAAEVNGAISPLSPRAFAYYEFEYLGFFSDRGHNINKIRVTPRSAGDNVFDGTIYIVDDLWSIHSLSLHTFIWGIRFQIDMIYEPIKPAVWLPINQIYDVTGSVFGFGFEYQYFANLSEYQITLNPNLQFVPDIIDEKVASVEAEQAEAQLANMESDALLEALESGEEVSRKQLRKILREYEKEELVQARSDTLEDVISIASSSVDSAAYDRDSLYWQTIRPIPLSKYEVKGYRIMDSISLATAKEDSATAIEIGSDENNNGSTQRTKEKFGLSDLIFSGARYRISANANLGYEGLLANAQFNTVEGYHLTWRPYLAGRADKLNWRVGPEFRYSFARDRLLPALSSELRWGRRFRRSMLAIDLGHRIEQINHMAPISPIVNSLNSLLFERNYMKVMQEEGYRLFWQTNLSPVWSVEARFDLKTYQPLSNLTKQVIFGSDERSYTSNTPFNIEIGETTFQRYRQRTLGLGLKYRPGIRYRLVDGRRELVDDAVPTFHLNYDYGSGDQGAEFSYHHIALRYEHQIPFGIRGHLNLDMTAGWFSDHDGLLFPSFKHFPGNRTFINVTDPKESFRLLPYYGFSTQEEYLQLHASYQFRKFLLTQSPLLRLSGLRENIFVNWLETSASQHYFEIGFGINYLFRFLRLEFVQSFQDFQAREFGVRLGVAADFETLFN